MHTVPPMTSSIRSFGRCGPLPILLVLGFGLSVAGCVTESRHALRAPFLNPAYAQMYGEQPNEAFPLPATDISEVDPKYFRREVAYPRNETPGTIVVDPGNKFLYLVLQHKRAIRYGVGVGKAGLAWSGEARIKRKAAWPRWTPTENMIAREPERNARWRGGMAGGLQNPLGARALYLYQGDRDTMYRIHGTTEPNSIGTSVSSGCIRMFNQDIIDLHGRVPLDTHVVVLGPGQHVEPAGDAIARVDLSRRGG